MLKLGRTNPRCLSSVLEKICDHLKMRKLRSDRSCLIRLGRVDASMQDGKGHFGRSSAATCSAGSFRGPNKAQQRKSCAATVLCSTAYQSHASSRRTSCMSFSVSSAFSWKRSPSIGSTSSGPRAWVHELQLPISAQGITSLH